MKKSIVILISFLMMSVLSVVSNVTVICRRMVSWE